MLSGDTNTVSGIYCRKCGYDLRGQTEVHRCPECGRGFDPANRKTFHTRSLGEAVWRWAGRLARLLLSLGLLLGLLLAMCWGWLYLGWKSEQAAVAKTKVIVHKVEPLGGAKLKGRLGSAAWVLGRIRDAEFWNPTTDADLIHIIALKELRRLDLSGTKVTDAGLTHLRKFRGLQDLELWGTQVTDTGLISLKELRDLQRLGLGTTKVSDAGLVHLKQIKGLQVLDLRHTHVTDAGLVHITEFKGLVKLDLSGTQVTAEGVDKLQAALPGIEIIWPVRPLWGR